MYCPISLSLSAFFLLSTSVMPSFSPPTVSATPLPSPRLEPGGGNDANCDLECQTDRLLFSTDIVTFGHQRLSQIPATLDWNSNGCSVPDWAVAAITALTWVTSSIFDRNNPFGFQFETPCKRHDFGYNNYRAQGRFTPDAQDRIDENFKKDVYDYCAQFAGWRDALRGVRCRSIADKYYWAVKSAQLW